MKSEIFSKTISTALILFLISAYFSGIHAAKNNPDGRLNINTASINELMLLPGIGKDKAKKILELKKSIKGFKYTHDLLKVKGLGKKLYAKIEKYIKVSGNSDFKVAKN